MDTFKVSIQISVTSFFGGNLIALDNEFIKVHLGSQKISTSGCSYR